MSLEIRFSAAAAADVRQGAAWYDRHSLELGNRFREEVKAALFRVRSQPELFARIAGNIRRAGVKQFPYSIYFSFVHPTLLIGAIVRDGRDLQYILSRFESP